MRTREQVEEDKWQRTGRHMVDDLILETLLDIREQNEKGLALATESMALNREARDYCLKRDALILSLEHEQKTTDTGKTAVIIETSKETGIILDNAPSHGDVA